MNKVSRIFIIGHIGAGKALVGKKVADKLGWQYVDADLGLEARTGRFLSEIVGKPEGVAVFLQCQTDILQNQLKNKNTVIVTDSSLLASEANKSLLDAEFVLYLQVSLAVQMDRQSKGAATLLPVKDFGKYFDDMHRERDSVFEKAATLTINTDDGAIDEHVTAIVNAIRK